MTTIAAISQMEIISKIHDDELGTKLIVKEKSSKMKKKPLTELQLK